MLTYRGGLPKKVKRVIGKGRSLTARKAETVREMVLCYYISFEFYGFLNYSE